MSADRNTAVGAARSWSEDALTARSRAVWSSADFLPIARSFARGAEEFVARLALRPGEVVLDVACGTGNLAIPAARAGARVIGTDIAPNLIAQARIEARAHGLPIDFDVGDAEQLPYDDGQFETTMTMFGAMFAYRPERAAAELLRVTRRNGRISMANWTPDGVIAKLLRAHAAMIPPPAGIPSPLSWGEEATVRARFGRDIRELTTIKRSIDLSFPFPPAGVAELFSKNYGPTVTTMKTLDPSGASQLRDAMVQLFQQHNVATDGTTTIVGEYLDVLAVVA
jgi:ubiquinone/menaquinone biosynthesis C-methylase UbiE